MHTIEKKTSWSIHEAIAVGMAEFTSRFGDDVLWQAFQLLTLSRDVTLAEHARLEEELDRYLKYPLSEVGSTLDLWMAKARVDGGQAQLLVHAGICWWLARDDLLSRPSHSRVPCDYSEGELDHFSLQLLSQMLYRGRAPYTTCD